MWFIANIIERYTSGVARTFLRLAAHEAEAHKRTLEDLRARRERIGRAPSVAHPEAAPVEPVAVAAPETASPQVIAEVDVAATIVEVPGISAAEEVVAETPAVSDVVVAAGKPDLDPNRTFPMGVRGEVVLGWVDALFDASRAEVAGLVETLRKDKRVRVAELRIIAAEVLGEEPENRKKGEYLAAIRERLAPDFPQTVTDAGFSLHA